MMRPLTVVAPVPEAAEVVGRLAFYNNSAFDGRGATADARDDAAVATDKQALLPMQTATFANLTAYARGINGIFLDVRNLPGAGGGAAALSAADFVFKAGITGDPAMWPDAPPPTSVTVRRGAGTGGSDRVTLTWPDGAIKNRWLRVQVLANSRTALASPDVFYFGNLVGECGNGTSAAGFVVNGSDVRLTRSKLFTRHAGIANRYDFNRDRAVNSLDMAVVRSRQSSSLPVLSAPDEGGHVMSIASASAAVFAQGPVVIPELITAQALKSSRDSDPCPCCGTVGSLLACS
jgi:hypothetical protein